MPTMPPPVVPIAAVADASEETRAEQFVLNTLRKSGKALSLGDLVHRGLVADARIGPEGVRSAVAGLLNEGRVEITSALSVRLSQNANR